MKYLLTIALVLSSLSVFAEDIPTYLKDGVITVTLKDGKQYTFSANEYKVVKRGSKAKAEVAQEETKPAQEAQVQHRVVIITEKDQRHKHIVSGELVRSKNGLDTTTQANEVDIKTKKEIGVGIQYQYNIYRDLYLGGRFDSNGGTGINFGVGF